MKAIIFKISILFIFLIAFDSTEAQSKKDTISTEYSFWGNSYFINGQKSTRNEIIDLLKSDSESKDLISGYRKKRSIGQITLVSGLLLNAYSIVDLSLNQANYGYGPQSTTYIWTMGIGLGLDIVGIIFLSNSSKDFRNAISIYNNNLKSSLSSYNIDIKIQFNRINLTCSF